MKEKQDPWVEGSRYQDFKKVASLGTLEPGNLGTYKKISLQNKKLKTDC